MSFLNVLFLQNQNCFGEAKTFVEIKLGKPIPASEKRNHCEFFKRFISPKLKTFVELVTNDVKIRPSFVEA